PSGDDSDLRPVEAGGGAAPARRHVSLYASRYRQPHRGVADAGPGDDVYTGAAVSRPPLGKHRAGVRPHLDLERARLVGLTQPQHLYQLAEPVGQRHEGAAADQLLVAEVLLPALEMLIGDRAV